MRSIKFDLTHDMSLKQLYLVATNSFLMKYLLAIASVAALSIPGVALAQKSIPEQTVTTSALLDMLIPWEQSVSRQSITR